MKGLWGNNNAHYALEGSDLSRSFADHGEVEPHAAATRSLEARSPNKKDSALLVGKYII